MDVLVDRVAGLDVHKRQATAAVRTPGEKRRVEEVREYSTYTEGLRQLRGWLEAEDVSVVAMEARLPPSPSQAPASCAASPLAPAPLCWWCRSCGSLASAAPDHDLMAPGSPASPAFADVGAAHPV